jgi:hypothetical protein
VQISARASELDLEHDLSPRIANAPLFALQDDGFPSGNLDCLPDLVRQNGPCEWRDIRNRAEGRIGLILANDAECLLAAAIPAQTNCGPERCFGFVGRRFDHFRARPPCTPISDFPQSGCRRLLIAVADRRAVGLPRSERERLRSLPDLEV